MILAQYNVLKFYSSLDQRTWNRQIDEGGNEEAFRIFLETNHVPAIQLIVDHSAEVTAVLEIFDTGDNPVGMPLAMTVEDGTTYKRLIYPGTVLSGNDDGDYYLKVTYNSKVVYSDVFGWTSNSAKFKDLVKITATSSNIRLGRNYLTNLTNFTFECYLNAEYMGIQPEISDDVTEKDGSNNVLYANLVPTREFELEVPEYSYRFLSGLRILEVNGTVTFTWKGLTCTANDILVESVEEHFPGLQYRIKVSFVDHSEIVSVVNETN